MQKKPPISIAPLKDYVRISKGAGALHFELLEGKNNQPIKFNQNYIDQNISPSTKEFQVIGRHFGHDHGYGIYHLHNYKSETAANQGAFPGIKQALDSFLEETTHEITTHYGSNPSHISHDYIIKNVLKKG